MTSKVFWDHLEQHGSECLVIREQGTKVDGAGTVVFLHNHHPQSFAYSVTMDGDWVTKKVEVSNLETGHSLLLHTDGEGDWYEGKELLLELSGAIDVDLSLTPFSNSLPINRFRWSEGEKREIDVVYIEAPRLSVKKRVQQYTYLGFSVKGVRQFRYRCGGYETVISVDEKGIVTEYPEAFIRRW